MDKNDRGRQLWLAAVLLTRVPLPHLPNDAFSKGADAVWAYPLIGIVVGACGVLLGQLSLWFGLPVYGAATLTLTTMMLLTGAMHEDGLADVFDGFWGGYTPERRLEIMRDSQIGTFGVLALIMVSTLRISAIAALLVSWWPAIIVGTVLSRAVMPILMNILPHARNDGLSHSVGQPTPGTTTVGRRHWCAPVTIYHLRCRRDCDLCGLCGRDRYCPVGQTKDRRANWRCTGRCATTQRSCGLTVLRRDALNKNGA